MPPTVCRANLIHVDQISKLFSCRGGGRGASDAGWRPETPSGASELGTSPQGQTAAANPMLMLLQGMHDMQQKQMEFMQRVMDRGSNKGRLALEDKPRSGQQPRDSPMRSPSRSPARSVRSGMSRADWSRSLGQEARGTDHRGEGGRAERLGGKDVLSMMEERDQDRAEDREGAKKGEAARAKKKASVGGKAKATAKSGAKAKAKKRKTTKKTPLKAASIMKRPSAASDTKLPKGWTVLMPYPGRHDKYYVNAAGKQFHSIKEVNRYYGKTIF